MNPATTATIDKWPETSARPRPQPRPRWSRTPRTLGAMAGVVLRELIRRKDFYVLFVLTALLSGVMAFGNFFGDDRMFRYVKEICLLLIWVSSLIIALTTAARQIPAEREQRTLLPLLAKPITRSQVVCGKFLGCWLACGLALLVFYVFFGGITMAKEHAWPWVNYFQALWLHWMLLGIVVAMTLLGSVVLAAPSSTVTIGLVVIAGMMLVGRHLHTVALGLPEPGRTLVEVLYYTLPHLEFFDLRDLLIHNWAAVPFGVCAKATAYASAYTLFFLVAACACFRRKPVN